VQAQHGKTKIQQRWYQVPDPSDHDETRLNAVAGAAALARPAPWLFAAPNLSAVLVGLFEDQGFSALALFE
jgi:ATP-independent RNA helicase DbpA